LDHVIVFNEASLYRHVKVFLTYYHESRTHLSLTKDTPEPRPVHPPELGSVVAIRRSVAFTAATSDEQPERRGLAAVPNWGRLRSFSLPKRHVRFRLPIAAWNSIAPAEAWSGISGLQVLFACHLRPQIGFPVGAGLRLHLSAGGHCLVDLFRRHAFLAP
jgi:hypothetical protein